MSKVGKMGRGSQRSYKEEQISKLEKEFFAKIDSLNLLRKLQPKDINEFADKLGDIIHEDIATSQLRKVYGEIKRLQRGKTFEAKALEVLAPRLAYAAARKPELKHVYELFEKCKTKIEEKEDLDMFVYLLEALVAYHKYHHAERGGRSYGFGQG